MAYSHHPIQGLDSQATRPFLFLSHNAQRRLHILWLLILCPSSIHLSCVTSTVFSKGKTEYLTLMWPWACLSHNGTQFSRHYEESSWVPLSSDNMADLMFQSGWAANDPRNWWLICVKTLWQVIFNMVIISAIRSRTLPITGWESCWMFGCHYMTVGLLWVW